MRFLNRISGSWGNRAARLARALFAAAGFCACVALGAGLWLWHTGELAGDLARLTAPLGARLFDIGARNGLALAKVVVEGRNRQSADSILAALDVRLGMPVLDIDLAAAQARVQSLPWVRSAEIERRMPDTLFVGIEERQPFAFWQQDGKLSLIDRDGSAIAVGNIASYGPLIVLVGDDAPANAAKLIDLLQTRKDLAARVRAAVRLGGRRWNLQFDDGVVAELPEPGTGNSPENAMDAAWQRLADLEASERVLERNIVSVDLRLPDRIVLKETLTPAAKSNQLGPASRGKAT
jgi:cell division protein FtsQ